MLFTALWSSFQQHFSGASSAYTDASKAIVPYACVVRSEELGRPENKDLKSFIDKLAGVKQIIDDKGKTAGEPFCLSAIHCSALCIPSGT